MKSGVMEEVKKSFKPEFINRIDEIIVFHQLGNSHMKEIITLLASNLCKRSKVQMGIELSLSATLKDYLVEKYADFKMGARPLKRAIQTEVEDVLAEEILRGNIKEQDKVTATYKRDKKTGEGKVVFVKK